MDPKTMWGVGDYAAVAEKVTDAGEACVERAGIEPEMDVLDIACGTGRILLPCLQAGVDIEGLDLFEPMLKTLRAKAAALGLSPRLHQADMSDCRRY